MEREFTITDLENFEQSLNAIINQSKKKCSHPDTHTFFTLFLPEWIMKQYLLRVANGCFIKPYNVDFYMGYRIVWGYENKIILAHQDYTLYQEEWMYYEIDLNK